MQSSEIRKALSVALVGSGISSYLPEPLAMEVIEHIRELSVMRRLLKSFKMNSRRWKKPKRSSGMSGYYIPDGVTATLSAFTSTSVEWVARKLMTYTTVDEEAIEDSQPDVVAQILMDFADAMAEAEEYAFLSGDPTHLATAPTPDSATASNWYVRDSRLAFEGIFTVAISADAADSVDASSAAFSEDFVNRALYNLGKYGRNRSRLVGLLPSDQAAAIRQLTNLKDASKTGLSLASFISGLGTAGEGDGFVVNLYGVKFYEVPLAPAQTVVIMDRSAPEIGDRRMIRSRNETVIESEQVKYVTSERLAFQYNRRDQLVAIENLAAF